ncbi:MAG: SsrA-binding protein, partial [bacterium]
SQFGHEPERHRKLLLHRQEIERLRTRIQERGLTVIPLRLYWQKGRAKAELGIGRGKKLHDKRESIATRESERKLRQAVRRRAKHG